MGEDSSQRALAGGATPHTREGEASRTHGTPGWEAEMASIPALGPHPQMPLKRVWGRRIGPEAQTQCVPCVSSPNLDPSQPSLFLSSRKPSGTPLALTAPSLLLTSVAWIFPSNHYSPTPVDTHSCGSPVFKLQGSTKESPLLRGSMTW